MTTAVSTHPATEVESWPLVDDPGEEPELEQCGHYLCPREEQPETLCGTGFDHCCGCCDGDPDALWEAHQELTDP